MALIELNQYENLIFPNLDILQKTFENILGSFRHLKQFHIEYSGIDDDTKQLDDLNRELNDFVGIRAKESLKMSIDLEHFIKYFKMIKEGDVTVNDLLETLLLLKDIAEKRIDKSEELKTEFGSIRESISTYIAKDFSVSQQPKLVKRYQLFKFIIPFLTYFFSPYMPWYQILNNASNNYFYFNLQSILALAASVPCLLDIFNRKNGVIMMNSEEQKKVKKYEEKISINLPVISTHLETLTQFWKQQFNIFESHIIVLKLMDGDANIKLSNNLAAGIIKKCKEEKINCKKFDQMLRDCVFINYVPIH
ncbi:8131_t:CDS:1 [Entrophospora sp. SA101]|nr:6984_t:CDS:1 [Entrophospora sp. SA101]CAJ0640597.1 8131_t:CDS:1 [Entrophospora sp. SA101]CAJ0835791.1 1013_t:CDS:1 [Entrophospora sp. SA101]CAJ0906286.1 10394_t:CDS:1 [Entrophospora sp. SA101]